MAYEVTLRGEAIDRLGRLVLGGAGPQPDAGEVMEDDVPDEALGMRP